MKLERTRNPKTTKIIPSPTVVSLVVLICAAFWFGCSPKRETDPFRFVGTVAGTKGEFGEPFGLAVKGSDLYVSDGQSGTIWLVRNGTPAVFAAGLATPSAIAFEKNGNLLVADSGSHSIRSVNLKGDITTIAGVDGRAGYADGNASAALFNAPIGIAVGGDGKIYVADTYNDRIRVIENGRVSTFAGSGWGYADGTGADAKFHTPCGLALWNDKLLVADTENRRIRVVEADGRVWTLAGDNNAELRDGLLPSASFVQPAAIAVDANGTIFVADGNAIRFIAGQPFAFVRTASASARGLADGQMGAARFNRPSGIAIGENGNLIVADSENRLLREFTADRGVHEINADEIALLRRRPEEFRTSQPPRWPYDPPDTKRDIAGTLGEIRGEIPETTVPARFHNGLDIAGTYGETARFVRSEKVLRPLVAENFGTLREFIRMPSMGYIHIRLGRNVGGVPFADDRFQFEKDPAGKIVGVRVPRGAAFNAGDAIGTLNQINHVHLIAGPSGSEMNALDALIFPGLTDKTPPVIERVSLFDENWHEIEAGGAASRIRLAGRTRIVVRAFDRADGNSDRRRLGIYRIGYQILRPDGSPLTDVKWTIRFDRMPAAEAVKFAYAPGSRSGATGETIFNYNATNTVNGDEFHEDLFDASTLGRGVYVLRAFAADYFGNTTHKEISFEVIK